MKSMAKVILAILFGAGLFLAPLGQADAAKRCKAYGKNAADLVLMTEGTNLRFSGNCALGRSLVVGTVTIKNVGRKTVPVVGAPLISVWDLDKPNFKDEDRTLNTLAPGETLTKRIQAGRLSSRRKSSGIRRFMIKVDRRHKVTECREDNNTWPRIIRIDVRC